ncbi:MAG: hypothetical protein WCE90_05525 [Candidatus Zixiibacteriota bacterium]
MIIVGAIVVPLITDTVLDWRRHFLKRRDTKTKKEVLRQRHEEDLKVWDDSVRRTLDTEYDIKYGEKLRYLREKLQEVKRQPGAIGLEYSLRAKIEAIENEKNAEFNKLLEIKKREMKRQIEDMESE